MINDILRDHGIGSGKRLKGNAQPAEVLVGKTFSNSDGNDKVGTMANRGAVAASITTQGGIYTPPAGYHNGSGTVTANISNLVASNIKKDVNVGEVVGTYKPGPADGLIPAEEIMTGGEKILLRHAEVDFDTSGITIGGTFSFIGGVQCKNGDIVIAFYVWSGSVWQTRVTKYTKNLVKRWSYTYTGSNVCNDLCVDSAGNVFIILRELMVKKLNSSTGTQAWSYTLPSSVYYPIMVRCDNADSVVVITQEGIVKLTNGGALSWKNDDTDTISGNQSYSRWQHTFIDAANNIYYALQGKLKKYDAAGTLKFSIIPEFDSTGWGNQICVDTSGNIYIVGSVSNAKRLVKYDAAGVKKWAYAANTQEAFNIGLDETTILYPNWGVKQMDKVNASTGALIKQYKDAMTDSPMWGFTDAYGNTFVFYNDNAANRWFFGKFDSADVQKLMSSNHDDSHEVWYDADRETVYFFSRAYNKVYKRQLYAFG